MEPCFRLLTAQLERPLPGEQSAVVSSACRALPELPGNQNDLAVAVLNLVTEHHELCWSTLVSILRLCNGIRAGLTPTPDLLDTPIRIPASICAGNERGRRKHRIFWTCLSSGRRRGFRERLLQAGFRDRLGRPQPRPGLSRTEDLPDVYILVECRPALDSMAIRTCNAAPANACHYDRCCCYSITTYHDDDVSNTTLTTAIPLPHTIPHTIYYHYHRC